jgi:hypothetical protein
MSTNKKFRIQNGVDVSNGDISINDVTVIGADGKVVPAAIADAVAGLTSSDIADLQAQVSAILGTSPETLDTLQEIVAAFENADSSLTGSVAQNASDIATINTTLTNGVATPTDVADLQSQVTSNDTDIAANAAAIAAANSRTSGISTSSGSSNIQMAAEVDMDSNKVTNMTDPTAAQDAATKAYVDAGDSASVSTAAADATSKADAAEASAKSHADAGDVANSNEINVETARAVAVEGSLQAQIDTVSSGGVSGRQSLQDAIDAEEVARIAADAVLQSNIDAEASARAGADNTLQSNIDTVSAAVSAITNGSPETLNQLTELVAAYEGADTSLQTLIDNLGGDASALTGRVSTLESEMDATETATSSNASAIAAEVVRATAAEGVNASAISAEASARAAAVSAETTARQNAITAETNARILADNGLQSQIDALDNSTTGDKSDLQAQITSNDNDIAALQSRAGTIEADYATQASLNNEISRASSAEAVNAAAISDEQTRATAAEQSNAAAITQEILDRQSADAILQSQIDFIEENTDQASLDSLTEIVSAFQSADSSTLGVVNSNTSRISALESGVVAIEAWDTDNVSEGQVNLYFTESRAKACVGADNGSCIDYNQASGKFSLDLSETAGALVPDNSTNSDKLDGQHGSHYRIDVYDVNGTVVN